MSQDKYVWQGLALIARYHGNAVNIEALRAQFGTDANHHINVQLVRAARHCGLRVDTPTVSLFQETCLHLL